MRIAILGTRGIPNNYGGFEQFAEYLAVGLKKKGHQVLVYNSHNHPYQKQMWNEVQLIHKIDPENKLGTMGQFIYDLNCIIDVRKRDCDIVLQLGYTSSSIWGRLLPKKSVIFTNMDGLEWQRTKYNKLVKHFLMIAEKFAIKFTDHLISDSIGIKEYIAEKYNKPSSFIAYGAHVFNNPDVTVPESFNLTPMLYDMLVARLVSENSIETILDGVVDASVKRPFIVIGNYETKYGKYLKSKYSSDKRIMFLGSIYDINILNNLRYFSNIYFHGHTVGGTNPSLLEAMACQCLISAHDNCFNKHILKNDGFYFKTKADISNQIATLSNKCDKFSAFLYANTEKIENDYSWQHIINKYENLFLQKVNKESTKKVNQFINEL